jgi:hypothetical protein
MMANFLDHLTAEILALERSLDADPRYIKLRELCRVRALYMDDSSRAADTDSLGMKPTPSQHSPSPSRKMLPETERVIIEAEGLLAGRSSPTPLRDIFHQVVEVRGCHIGGKDPVNGLSSILSRAGKFKAHGRSGWTMATDEPDPQTETPNSNELFGAPKTNGAMPLSP